MASSSRLRSLLRATHIESSSRQSICHGRSEAATIPTARRGFASTANNDPSSSSIRDEITHPTPPAFSRTAFHVTQRLPKPRHVPKGAVPSAAPVFDRKGRRIHVRPKRVIPVTLPGGWPEPPDWPPPKEYLDKLEKGELQKQKPHPLWKFFYVPVGAETEPSASQDHPPFSGALTYFPDSLEQDKYHISGRAWTMKELRVKSFRDLHTLWWLCLRELNTILTQTGERKRVRIFGSNEILNSRKQKCRKTMKFIKQVLGERRLGLISAVGPHLKPRSPLPQRTDPANQQGAIWGISPSRTYEYEEVEEVQAAEEEDPAVEQTQETLDAIEGPVVDGAHVSEEEVKGRDEGFGGGEEAKDFVEGTEVDRDGKLHQK